MTTMEKHIIFLLPPSGHHPLHHTLHPNFHQDNSNNTSVICNTYHHRSIRSRYCLTTFYQADPVPDWLVTLLSACKQLRIRHLTHYYRAINLRNTQNAFKSPLLHFPLQYQRTTNCTTNNYFTTCKKAEDVSHSDILPCPHCTRQALQGGSQGRPRSSSPRRSRQPPRRLNARPRRR